MGTEVTLMALTPVSSRVADWGQNMIDFKPHFESESPLAVTQIRCEDGKDRWQLTDRLVYYYGPGPGQFYKVPGGPGPKLGEDKPEPKPGEPEPFVTDFASVPSVLTWLVPSTTTTGIPAAVLHDYLWKRAEMTEQRKITYREADRIFRQALRALGVGPVQRWLMWAAVRWWALIDRKDWRGWYRDAPAVLAVTVMAMPFIVPALVTLPFLGLYKILEMIAGFAGSPTVARPPVDRPALAEASSCP